MKVGSVICTSNSTMASTALLICACILITLTPASYGQDSGDKASSMLDNLKRRTPEERWQRIKKLYPADPAPSRRNTPSQLPDNHQSGLTDNHHSGLTDNHQSGLTDDQLPPSPVQTQLIPRLSAVPIDDSNDWVVPAQDPVALADAISAQPDAKAAGSDAAKPTEAPATKEATAPSPATQEEEMKAGPVGDVIVGTARPLRERKIEHINPYYDRDRDNDIRNFAIEKGKEFGVFFRPAPYADRSFPEIVLAWEATNYFYHPLYFNDSALERYGHVHHPLIQPFASIGRFGVQTIFLPYQMTIDPPFEKVSPLGYYRPGDVIPKLHYQVPLNAQAAVVEAGFIAGLYFVIP